jgi:putative pyruvate formate lyase activating enzyme
MARQYSAGAASYPEVTAAAIREMHRQVGTAHPAADGLMYRGLMIRHLVLPNEVSGTRQVLAWVAANLPRDTYVNLMSQYRPAHRARDYPALSRRLTGAEFQQAARWARESGLTNVEIQGGRG